MPLIFSLYLTYSLSLLFFYLDLFPHLFILSHFKLHCFSFSPALLVKLILFLSVIFLFLPFTFVKTLLLFSFKTLSLNYSFSFRTFDRSTSERFLHKIEFRLGGDLVLLKPLVILFEKGEIRFDFGNEVPHILLLLIGNGVIHSFFLMLRFGNVAFIKHTKGAIELTKAKSFVMLAVNSPSLYQFRVVVPHLILRVSSFTGLHSHFRPLL